MNKDEYYECKICLQLCDNNSTCPNCNNNTVHRVVELKGIAITGSKVYKIEEEVYNTLLEFINKNIVITIRE